MASSSDNFFAIPPPEAIDQEPIPVEDIDLEGGDVVDHLKITSGGDSKTTDDGFDGIVLDDSEDDTAVDSDESHGEQVMSSNANNGRRRRRRPTTIIVGIALIVTIIVILSATLGTREQRNQPSSSSSTTTLEMFTCTSPVSTATSSWSSCPKLVNPVDGVSANNNRTAVAERIGASIEGEASGDLFGTALSVNCDATIVAVGSSQHDDRSGHVKVYKWASADMIDNIMEENLPTNISKIEDMSGVWIQMGQTLDGKLGSNNQFGHAVSISSDGYRLAISGRFADTTYDNGTIADENVGSVRTFAWSTTSEAWQPMAQVLWGEAVGDQSGRSVQLNWDGTRTVIGATGNDDGGDSSGHARVYELTSSNAWLQLGNDIDGESLDDYSGNAVAMSADGTVVAIGAYKNDGTNSSTEDAGHVRVFKYDDAKMDFFQIGADIDGDASGDWLGQSVALSGDGTRLIVGAPGNNERFWPGVSKVYDLVDGKSWEQIGDDLEGGGFSVDISVDGSRVVLGSHRGFENGPNTGQVLVYDFDDASKTWIPILGEGNAILGEQGSLFGTAVGMSSTGDRLVASAPAVSGFVGSVTAYGLCPVA
jgi:FG-GAP repeat